MLHVVYAFILQYEIDKTLKVTSTNKEGNMVQKDITPVDLKHGDALSVTDVQNDFLPGGALAVPEGDRIIPFVNRAIGLFVKNELPVFFSRDWHPSDHSSFKNQGGPWPPHCVQNTPGAEFPSDMKIPEGAIVISKGHEKGSEQYSSLGGRDENGDTQSALLKKLGIKRVFVIGLATDYCVLNSVKDACAEGYEVYVLTDAIRAVDVNPGDGEKALDDMKRAGAKTIKTEDIRNRQ
jgi:nicotinamidase/pyrazinamidase